MSYENYQSVLQQMLSFGIQFKDGEQLTIPTEKRKTCGVKGKYWYWLREWQPRHRDGTLTGKVYIVGTFGTYKHGGSERKIELDFTPPTEEEKKRWREERESAIARERQAKEEAAKSAAMTAVELWQLASKSGSSPYLERKGVQAESCRFLAERLVLGRRDPRDKPIFLPPGTLVLPLIRYDKPREEALRGLQFIKPDGFKVFGEGFAKPGCCIRLGKVDASTRVVLVCEGYATGLSIRMATGRRWPVYVALDAYNLVWVVEILRAVHQDVHLLVCADDDWKTEDHEGKNPGRRKALAAARTTPRCDIVWPVFDPETRQEKDTDFNDLHQRQGLEAVEKQLLGVLSMIERGVRIGR